MQPLSGLDASFLYLEEPAQPLHVCALVTLDPGTVPGGYSFGRFREQLAQRVRSQPAFRRRLHDSRLNLGHPIWVTEERIELATHLHRVVLPAPGGREELAELCARIAERPLERTRPLWEMHVIEGRADGSVAVLAKMHHASVDGVSGANLLLFLTGAQPDAPAPEPAPDDTTDAAPPGRLELLREGAFALARKPSELVRLAPGLAAMAPRWIAKSLRGKGMPVPFTAPRTLFNRTITARRAVAYAEIDLDEVKAVKNAFAVTVNDVVLAACAGALRAYLAARDGLPGEPLVATVPVSVHARSERNTGNNKVSAFFAALPTHLPDPGARVFAVAESNRLAKEHHYSIDADMLSDWAQFAAPVLGLGVRAYARLRLADRHPVVHNLVISNVAGPPVPLYLLGARMTGIFPLGPVFHGAGLNVTVLSSAGKVHVGLLGARELVGDLWPLADAIPRALDELRSAAPGPG